MKLFLLTQIAFITITVSASEPSKQEMTWLCNFTFSQVKRYVRTPIEEVCRKKLVIQIKHDGRYFDLPLKQCCEKFKNKVNK